MPYPNGDCPVCGRALWFEDVRDTRPDTAEHAGRHGTNADKADRRAPIVTDLARQARRKTRHVRDALGRFVDTLNAMTAGRRDQTVAELAAAGVTAERAGDGRVLGLSLA